MGLVAKNLRAKNLVAYNQPIYFVGWGTGSTAGSGTSVASSWSFTTPKVGDLMVVIVSSNNAAGNTWTPPAGWNELTDPGVAPNISICWKNYVVGDPSSWLWTSTVSGQLISTMLIYRNAAIDLIGGFGTVTSGSTAVVAPAISTTANNSIVLSVFASSAGTAFSTPTGTTQINSYTVGTTTHAVFWNFQQTAAQTGTRTSNATATGSNVGIMLGIKAA